MSKKMFSLAMPGRPEIFDFDDRSAQFYKDCGYTGIYLENDYCRFGSHATWGCWIGVCEVLSLWRFSKDESADKYLDWIRAQTEVAHSHGLKVYLKVWEPRVPCFVRNRLPLEVRGSPSHGALPNACISAPAGNRFIREFHEEALQQLDMIDGLIVGVEDNFAGFCNKTCPHCAGKSHNDLILKYYRLLFDVVEEIRPELDIILYDWIVSDSFIPNDFINKMIKVSGNSLRTVTRFTQFAHQKIQGYNGPSKGIMDVTLAVDEPGPLTQSYLPLIKSGKLKLLDMVPTGNSLEFFGHPYAPVPGIFFKRWQRILKHGYDGFVDYDCGGMTPGIISEAMRRFIKIDCMDENDFLQGLAEQTYGKQAVGTVIKAWQFAEEALRAYPQDMAPSGVSLYSGRLGLSMVFTIGLVPRLDLFTGKDSGTDPFFGYPYSMLMPEIIDIQERQFQVVSEKMEQAANALNQAVALVVSKQKQFAQTEADRAQALAIMYGSQHNWTYIAQCIFKGFAGRTPAEADWVREAFKRELEFTLRYAEFHQKDRLIYSNPTWDIIGLTQQCELKRKIDRKRPFKDKIAILNEMLAIP